MSAMVSSTVASGDRDLHRGAVGDVAGDDLGLGHAVRGEGSGDPVGRADEHADVVPRVGKRHHRVGADEIGASGDEDPHLGTIPQSDHPAPVTGAARAPGA